MAENQDPKDPKNGGEGGEPKTDMVPKASLDAVSEKYKEAKAKLDQLETEKAEAEKAKLKQDGELQALVEKQEQTIKELNSKMSDTNRNMAISKVAQKMGAKDPSDIITLIGSKVEVSKDGTVDEAAVEKLIGEVKGQKAYLFGEAPKANIGAEGGAPAGGGQNPTFTRSQITDRKFYTEHRDDILKAQREGRIVDDVSQPSEGGTQQ